MPSSRWRRERNSAVAINWLPTALRAGEIEPTMIRVVLPYHLQTLARVSAEVQLEIPGRATPRSILDALEDRYPVLRGTIRDHVTGKRRPLVRFFACEEDFSNESPDTELPPAVASGQEPFFIVGAIAGG
jgi:molybdopterin synthase sulfur carrier subunit